ncbi:MAG: amidohydrolase family protein [Myxococcota bacterium]
MAEPEAPQESEAKSFGRGELVWLLVALVLFAAAGVVYWRRQAEPASIAESEPAPEPPPPVGDQTETVVADDGRFLAIGKIDVHVHIPASLIPPGAGLLRRYGIHLAFNASGGSPDRSLQRSAAVGAEHGVLAYCFMDWENAGDPNWNPRATLDACKAQGAFGVKISKALGLGYLIDDDLLAVDDPRLDDAFEYMGELGFPVLIHTGDPKAFFEPPTEENERFDELSVHPGWSFYGPRPDGGQWPSWRELLRQFEARVARHPGTTFIGAHFGNAPEDPDFVASMLERFPNYVVETGARVPEIGRHDADRMHDFFVRFQDRVLFGTDFQVNPGGLVLGSAGRRLAGLSDVAPFLESHWRYFETRDEDFAHPTPIQGDWTIDGVGLPEPVLRKIYRDNALRVFGLRCTDDSCETITRVGDEAPTDATL